MFFVFNDTPPTEYNTFCTLVPYATLFRSWLRMKPGICRRAIYAGAKLKAGPGPGSMPIKSRPEPAAPSTRAQALLSLGERRDGLGRRVNRCGADCGQARAEGHTSELQSLMRSSYTVFCVKTKQQS